MKRQVSQYIAYRKKQGPSKSKPEARKKFAEQYRQNRKSVSSNAGKGISVHTVGANVKRMMGM